MNKYFHGQGYISCKILVNGNHQPSDDQQMFSRKKNPQKNRMYGEIQQDRNGSESSLPQDPDS